MFFLSNILTGTLILQASTIDAAGQLTPTIGEAAAQDVGAGDVLIPNLLLIAAIVGMFIVLVYLPQRRRTKDHNSMLEALRKGDKVVTSGGIVGKIAKQPGDLELLIETGEGDKITVLRAAVTGKYSDVIGNRTNAPQSANDDSADDLVKADAKTSDSDKGNAAKASKTKSVGAKKTTKTTKAAKTTKTGAAKKTTAKKTTAKKTATKKTSTAKKAPATKAKKEA